MKKALVLYDLQNIFKKSIAIAPNIHLDLLYQQREYMPLYISLKQILSVHRFLKNQYQEYHVFVNDYGHRKGRGDYKQNRYTASGKYIFEENMKSVIRRQIYDSSITIQRDVDLEEEYKEWKKYQLDKLKEFCRIFGAYISAYEIEADELIAYIVQEYKDQDVHIYIVSTDKDFVQLVLYDNVFLIDTRGKKKEIIYKDRWQMEEYISKRLFGKKGVVPIPIELFVVAQSIFGDKADNLQGLKNIGVKFTEQILQSLIPFKKEILEYTFAGNGEALWEIIIEHSDEKIKKRILGQKEIFLNTFKEVNLVSPSLLQEKVGMQRMLDIQKAINSLPEIEDLSFYSMLIKNNKKRKQIIEFFKDIERPSLNKML